MPWNIGTIDRALRLVAGLALITAALGLYGPAYPTPWGWIGAILVGTAVIGRCPAYALFGFSSCGRKET